MGIVTELVSCRGPQSGTAIKVGQTRRESHVDMVTALSGCIWEAFTNLHVPLWNRAVTYKISMNVHD